MLLLGFAVAALVVGPAVLGPLRRRPRLTALLDGFVVASIPGLIFLHFVPAAVEETHLAVLAALVVGFLLPLVIERLVEAAKDGADRWGLYLGLTGLAIHAGLDGAALATMTGGDPSLGLAVVLHRLPVGIAVWWLVARTTGARSGVAALGALAVVTVVGFAFGDAVTRVFGGSDLVRLYQATVGGSLVHVVTHRSDALKPGGRPRAQGVGALAAVGLLVAVVALPGTDGHHGPAPFLSRLFVLSAESAPALLIAYLFAGLLGAFLPASSIRWMEGGGSLSQAGRGMLVGLPFPICSCGVVPLYQTLVTRGAPPAAAMAFLVATPELGLDAILLSIPLLGPEVTLVRVGTAAAAALLVGWWLGGRLEAHARDQAEGAEVEEREGVGARFRKALVTGTGEVVDHTAPWILLGLGTAALIAPWLDGGWLARLPAGVAVPLFAALGFPTYVCASSATPLVAALLAAGLSPGAGIAFLITGPATNLSTLGVLSSLHGRRAAGAFAAVLVAIAVGAGLAIDLLLPPLPVPSLADLTEEAPSALQLVCLAGLVLLFGASVARRGVRRFVGEIRDGLGAGHDHRDHDHDHDHHEGHAHA